MERETVAIPSKAVEDGGRVV